ncbi:MAG: hypothetical protein QOE33_2243 [Acidobacteriota bacterium]|nr:hypothetical protein [Acidobacteriota bacterium]
MKECVTFRMRACALALCAVACLVSTGVRASAQSPGYQGQGGGGGGAGRGGYQPSEGEIKAAQAVQQAADAPAAIAAAGEFLKKYAKSPVRARVGRMVADKIGAVQDATQRATLAESAAKLFDRPEEVAVVTPLLVNAYVDAKRFDDAFRVGGDWVGKHPEDVPMLTQLGLVGIDQARLRNAKFVAQSQQYAMKAVELMEANKKPATMDDAVWSSYKTEWLPTLYQSLGLLSFISGNNAESRTRLEKATTLGSSDPTTYALLADMADKDYEDLAKQAMAMKAGADRDAATKKAQAQLDKVIEMYAQSVAMSEGKTGFEQMHEQLLASLTGYYKYRKGSTDGMQQLIDKYKKTNIKL